MEKNNTTILNIGNYQDFDTFRKLHNEKSYARRNGFTYRSANFRDIFNGDITPVKNANVIVFICFPFKYWNTSIENRNYKGTYGNLTFYQKCRTFNEKLAAKLRKIIIADKVVYLNSPESSAFYRDKEAVKSTLIRSGINVPTIVKARSSVGIKRLLTERRKLYIKPRCGSMGKGITYLEDGAWMTNFKLRKNKTVNRHSDYGWVFGDVTDNLEFLKHILQKDIIIEEALDPFIIKGRKLDFRVYTLFDKVLYVYPRGNTSDAVTTNISQGGKGLPGYWKLLPSKTRKKVEEQAILAAGALGLDFTGVDVMLDRNCKNAYVLDVNMFPGFPKIRTYNLPRAIYREIKTRFC